MPFLRATTLRDSRAALSVRIALLGAVCLVGPLHAQELDRAVTIGGEPVRAADVAHALSECEAHAPNLTVVECLDTYWVPRWLLDSEARARKLAVVKGSEHVLAELLHRRLVRKISEDLPSPSEADIDAYLKTNARDFEKPERIRIFRILVAKKEEAAALIRKLSSTTTIADFRSLAREHSVDGATSERGGDLGFVWPDGSTDVPQVSAEPSLYKSAQNLVDGEFCAEPVVEGKRFAVIWRRGSLPAVAPSRQSRTLAAARQNERDTEAQVQQILQAGKSKVTGRASILLGKLRRKEASLFKEP